MKLRKIDEIKAGTVIDHLQAGTALSTIKLLNLKGDGTVLVGVNFYSSKYGKKDLIKIENKELTQEEINKIALLSPHASITIIKDFEVANKFSVNLPDTLEAIVKCANPKCITNHEPVLTKFHVLKKEQLQLRCHFCERAMAHQEIRLL